MASPLASPTPSLSAFDEDLHSLSSFGALDDAAAVPAAPEAAAAAPAAGDAVRRGKWTAPECDYAALVIEHFGSGRLPGLAGGESLRATLSELLGCAPMRITKKLSATRAHGKQCFKKRGELGARDRVALERARARFLASLDGGAPPAAARAPKRSRAAPADDGAWLASFRGDAWLDDGGALEPAGGAWRAAAAPRAGPRVSVAAARGGAGALARVVARDRDGLLGELSDVFARRGLNVVRCRCEAAPDGGCRDEFEVAAADGRGLGAGARDELRRALEAAAGADAPRATTLRVAAPDRPGLLASIAASLDALSLSVVGGAGKESEIPNFKGSYLGHFSLVSAVFLDERSSLGALSTRGCFSRNARARNARVEATSNHPCPAQVVGARITTVDAPDAREPSAVDAFDVVDADTGAPVLDPARLRRIEARLAEDIGDAPPPPPPRAAPAGDDAPRVAARGAFRAGRAAAPRDAAPAGQSPPRDAAPGGQSPASLYDALMERTSSFSSLLSAAEPSASPPGARDDDDDASVDYANVFAA